MRFLIVLCLAAAAGSDAARLEAETNSWKVRPVTKVVNLLKDMQIQLGKENDKDEEMYDKMACWCQTNEKSKTKAVGDAEQRSTDLTATIQENTAKSAALGAALEAVTNDIAKNQEALDQATAIRSTEAADWVAEEKDMISSIASLKGAVIALSKHQPTGLSQQAVLAMAQKLAFKNRGFFDPHDMEAQAGVFFQQNGVSLIQQRARLKTRSKRAAVPDFVALIQQHARLQVRTKRGEYEPASGQIFGILKQMKESFEQNLANGQEGETQAAEQFTALKAGKQEELSAGSEMKIKKTTEKAEADEAKALADQDLKDTSAGLKADTEFLLNLRKKCTTMDSEFEERTKTRQEEIGAVSEAIKILSGDEARDLFSKSLGLAQQQQQQQDQSFLSFLSFVQTGATTSGMARSKAAALLRHAGRAANNPVLIQLASSARLDAFVKVKEAIDKMANDLKAQRSDEVAEKDLCNQELHDNEKQQGTKTDSKEDKESEIADLQMSATNLAEAIASLKAEVADMQTEMKAGSESREKENAEFQQTIADQRATQVILKKAVMRLQQFYERQKSKPAAVLLQTSARRQQPPGQFGEYKDQGGGGVVALIENIIADSKRVEAATQKAEADAQASYEAFVADTTASTKACQNDIMNKQESTARVDSERIQNEGDVQALTEDLGSLAEMNDQIHQRCDFLLKNFDLRQQSLDQEIEALHQAKGILSGASAALIQTSSQESSDW